MIVRNRRDFWSGAFFATMGITFVIFSQEYELGTPARMGPGFFPAALGALLVLLGLVILWQSASSASEEALVRRIGWRELLLILAAITVFAVALPQLGMVISVALLIGISAFASYEVLWKETIVTIVVLLTLSWLVFVKGLNLQFPVWPTFLGN